MTREKALNILHNASVYHPDYLDALNMAIKALEQEKALEDIRAEIDAECGSKQWDDYDYYSGLITAKRIIDKHISGK